MRRSKGEKKNEEDSINYVGDVSNAGPLCGFGSAY